MRYTGEYLKELIFPLSGWREFIRTARNCRIILKDGSVTLSSVSLYGACVQKLVVDGKEKLQSEG